jgi:hypothetical protein
MEMLALMHTVVFQSWKIQSPVCAEERTVGHENSIGDCRGDLKDGAPKADCFMTLAP